MTHSNQVQGVVSLHLVSSPNEFLWHLIFHRLREHFSYCGTVYLVIIVPIPHNGYTISKFKSRYGNIPSVVKHPPGQKHLHWYTLVESGPKADLWIQHPDGSTGSCQTIEANQNEQVVHQRKRPLLMMCTTVCQSPSKCLCHHSSFWRRFVTYAIFWLTTFSRQHFISLSNHTYGTH